MNTSHLAPILGLCLSTVAVQAANLLVPSDPVIGGAVVGSNFEVGVIGTAGNVNNWPGAELPSDMTNGLIGGGGEKYLNFFKLNTGIIVSPAAGLSVINSMTLWVANDAPERDPASYELYGTNTAVSGTGPFALADFTLVSSGGLALPDGRDTVTDAAGLSETIAINATNSFTSYMLVFPTVKDAVAANSMQISEVQFDATLVPEPSVALLGMLGALGIVTRRRRA